MLDISVYVSTNYKFLYIDYFFLLFFAVVPFVADFVAVGLLAVAVFAAAGFFAVVVAGLLTVAVDLLAVVAFVGVAAFFVAAVCLLTVGAFVVAAGFFAAAVADFVACVVYTSDAADE